MHTPLDQDDRPRGLHEAADRQAAGSPAWVYVAAGLSLLLIGVVMALSGGAESPAVLYLFMAAVVFGYYLPTRAAIAFLAVGILVPLTPMLYDAAAREPDFIGRLLLTAPIYAAVGLSVVLAKRELVGWRSQALEQALRDPLTGLANRRALTNALRREMANSTAQTPVALLMIDLDDFKAINAAHGQVGGDQVLRGVADVLRRSTRADDVVARLGGDEFAILVAHASEPELARLSQRIVEAIRYAEIAVEPDGCKVTASVGVAMPNRRNGDVDGLIGYADRELRQAKRAGKDRWDASSVQPVATA